MFKVKYLIWKCRFYCLKQAFTLLELLLIIVIISVVLSISLPLISVNVRSMYLKSFVNKTCILLDYAKVQAVLKNIVLSVRFDSKDNKIFLLAKGKGEFKKKKEVIVPKNIYVNFDKDDIFFYPDGTFLEFKINIFDKNQRSFVISSSGFDEKIKVTKKTDVLL